MSDPTPLSARGEQPPALQRMPSTMEVAQQQAQAQAASPTSSSLGLDGYKVLCEIGTGTFGTVHKIQRKEDGEIMVWKELRYGKMNEKEKKQLVDEVNILRQLNHKHIVKYFDRIIDREAKKIYIVMEYCSGGDVASIIKQHQRSQTHVEEDFVWKILGEVASALEQCHKCGSGVILHRDLKPANIFLDNVKDKCVKLGDFGLARTLKDSFDYARTHVGTPYYMSPEQVLGLQYNGKSDIWSLGCLVYELAALSPPFRAGTHLQLEKKIRSGQFDRLPRQYSNELERVIRNMMNVEQVKRPTVDEVSRWVAERNERVRVEREQAAAAQQAIHRRRNSLTSAGGTAIGSVPSSTATSTAGSLTSVNLQLVQRESELVAQLSLLQKREEDLNRREAMLAARERRQTEREAQWELREQQQVSLGKGGLAGGLGTYRVPLSNLANYMGQR